jgi:hypothetical protein
MSRLKRCECLGSPAYKPALNRNLKGGFMVRISNLLWMFALLVCWVLPGSAQQPASGAANQIVPSLVNFSGALTNTKGKVTTGVVGLTFSLYKDAEGGAPLWVETQNVQPDKTGHYSVQLGAASSSGLPAELFAAGQARWLGVQQQGEAEQPRVLLLSVPYALKALDAETIGGKPASAFALAPSSTSSGSANKLPPGAITGSGTADFVPLFTGATTIADSKIFQSAAGNVGISTTTPAAKLDVSGTGDVRDTLTLFPKLAHNTLSIHGTAFAISSTGKVTFISGQTFPGTGTVTSVGSGAGLTGGPITTSGTLSIATGGVTNAMLAHSSLTVTANSPLSGGGSVSLGGTTTLGLKACAAGQILEFTGGAWTCVAIPVGTVTSVGSGLGLTGGPITGSGTLAINTSIVPQLAATNAFTNTNSFSVSSSTPGIGITSAGSGDGIDIAVSSSSGFGVLIEGSSFEGVRAEGPTFPLVGFGGSGEGVYGETDTDSNFSAGIVGIEGGSTQIDIGVEGLSESSIGVGSYGIAIGSSNEGGTISGSAAIGAWGDTSGDWGVLGTTDEGDSIVGFNASEPFATAYFENDEVSSLDAPVLVTVGGNIGGACMFDVSGDMYCSGTIGEAVPVDNGGRKVALYAMESPKSWSEDFGSGHLANGSAVIELESTFAQTVNTQNYHVFITPNGDCKGLYVSQKSAGGFEVRELGGGTSSIEFDYRIVAERRGFENVRMADKTQLFRQGAMLKGGKKRATPLRAPNPQRPQRAARTSMMRSALEPANAGSKAR